MKPVPIQKHILFILLLAFQNILCSQSAEAQAVQISLAANTNDPVWVGQRVNVIVEVSSETFFSGSTILTLPDISGAVFYKPEERALVSSKTIDGQTYSVQRHELSFYPQRAGDFTIPAFKVRFGIAGSPGEPATEYSVNTQLLKITAKMPPGAEHLSLLISSTELKISESWQPQISSTATVGDAFKRTLTLHAAEVPGMVFPTIIVAEVAGLKIYRERASIHDKINRGSLTGERIDRITYLCEQPGSYSLPAIVTPWWNLKSKKMEKITLPAVNFEVQPQAVTTSAESDTGEALENPVATFRWKAFSCLSLVSLIFITLILRYRQTILRYFVARQTRYHESEAAYFKRILRTTTPAQTLNAITAWLAHTNLNSEPLTLHAFASGQNGPKLATQLEALQVAVVSEQSNWQQQLLFSELKKKRKTMLQQKSFEKSPALPPINP